SAPPPPAPAPAPAPPPAPPRAAAPPPPAPAPAASAPPAPAARSGHTELLPAADAAPRSTDRLAPGAIDSLSRLEVLAARLIVKGEGFKRRVRLQSATVSVGRAETEGVAIP